MKKRIKTVIAATLALSLAATSGIGGASSKAAAKIKLNTTSVTLSIDGKATLKLKNVAKKKRAKVKWNTSDSSIVSVKANKAAATITGVSAGKATVTAKLLGKKYTCRVTVKKAAGPASASGYGGIDVAAPDWVAKLPEAQSASQIFTVAAYSETANDAWIALHEKQPDGTWHTIMTTPGFIGRNGLNKTKEGDSKTPTGSYKFNRAFGIADDPGCAIPYVKVNDDTYWSGDSRDGYHYNELVYASEMPEDFNKDDSEHLIEYIYHYQYCLNISYNESCTAGLGSAIFLHCFGPAKPFTGGCVAIPEDHMKFVMQHIDENTAVVINTYEALSGTSDWFSSTWPNILPS